MAVSIDEESGQGPTGLNGYIHSVEAAEDKPDANIIKVVIRLVDQDSDKLTALSTYIDRM